MKSQILHEIAIMKMSIKTYESMINSYMEAYYINPPKYAKKILDMNRRIDDTEGVIKTLRRILLAGSF